jgi:putative tricarboxylic transport membrane protein
MPRLVNKSNRDYFGGALMIVIGAAAAIQGQSYQIGSLSRMGPGFFPTALGVILALAGLAIIITAKLSVPEGEDKDLPPEWRGWFCICASIVAFVTIGKYGGLLPASFAIVFIAALGDRENTILGAAVLAASVCVVCVVIFWWALQVQFPLFTWG